MVSKVCCQSSNETAEPLDGVSEQKIDYLSDVTDEVALEILMNLNPRSILNLEQSSPFWKKKIGNEIFWREFCVRDFGRYGLNLDCSENFRESYIECYKSASEFTKKLPKCEVLLNHSTKGDLLPLYGLLDPRVFPEFIENLTLEELHQATYQVAIFGCQALLASILDSKNFVSIQGSVPWMREAFIAAASVGKVSSMKTISKNKRFAEISFQGEWGLGRALTEAVSSGQVQCAKFILDMEEFKQIPVIDHSSGYGLVSALHFAINARQAEAASIIIRSDKFKEVGVFNVAYLFKSLVIKGLIYEMKLVMNGEKWKELGPVILGQIFKIACSVGNKDAVRVIMEDEKFMTIPLKGKNSIGESLIEALNRKHYETADLLIFHPIFKNLDKSALVRALELSNCFQRFAILKELGKRKLCSFGENLS